MGQWLLLFPCFHWYVLLNSFADFIAHASWCLCDVKFQLGLAHYITSVVIDLGQDILRWNVYHGGLCFLVNIEFLVGLIELSGSVLIIIFLWRVIVVAFFMDYINSWFVVIFFSLAKVVFATNEVVLQWLLVRAIILVFTITFLVASSYGRLRLHSQHAITWVSLVCHALAITAMDAL